MVGAWKYFHFGFTPDRSFFCDGLSGCDIASRQKVKSSVYAGTVLFGLFGLFGLFRLFGIFD